MFWQFQVIRLSCLSKVLVLNEIIFGLFFHYECIVHSSIMFKVRSFRKNDECYPRIVVIGGKRYDGFKIKRSLSKKIPRQEKPIWLGARTIVKLFCRRPEIGSRFLFLVDNLLFLLCIHSFHAWLGIKHLTLLFRQFCLLSAKWTSFPRSCNRSGSVSATNRLSFKKRRKASSKLMNLYLVP